jgi:hypothetical protein
MRTVQPQRAGREGTVGERQRFHDERAREAIVVDVARTPAKFEGAGLVVSVAGIAAVGLLELPDDR